MIITLLMEEKWSESKDAGYCSGLELLQVIWDMGNGHVKQTEGNHKLLCFICRNCCWSEGGREGTKSLSLSLSLQNLQRLHVCPHCHAADALLWLFGQQRFLLREKYGRRGSTKHYLLALNIYTERERELYGGKKMILAVLIYMSQSKRDCVKQ